MKKLVYLLAPLFCLSSLVGCKGGPKTYIVSFETGLGTPKPEKQIVKENEYANKPKEEPSYSTDEKNYYFDCWKLDGNEFKFSETPITKDITLEASYTDEVRTYDVSFVNDDGTVLQSESLKYGEKIEYKGENPTKKGDAQYTYSFAGWKPTLTEGDVVKGNQTYVAQYDAKVNQYTVTFDSDGGTAVDSQTVDYNSTIIEPAEPTKQGTAQFSYSFLYWIDEKGAEFKFNTPITRDITLKAKWKQTTNRYTVTFICEGDEYTHFTVPYGDTIHAPLSPEKDPTHEIRYDFDGWYTSLEYKEKFDFRTEITNNFNLYGRFIEKVRTYVYVTFDTDGGTGDFPQMEVEKGYYATNPGSPTKAKDAQYTYKFEEWQLNGQKFEFESTKVNENIVLKAYYSKTINTYIVAFDTDGGTTIPSQTIEYGKHATRPSITPTKESKLMNYTFVNWVDDDGNTFDFDNTEITGNTTITAKWSSINWWEDETYINSLTTNDVGLIRGVNVNNVLHDVRLIGIDHDDLAIGSGKAHTTWEFATLFSNRDGNAELCCWQSVNSLNYINSALRKSIDGGGTSTKYGWESGNQYSIKDKLDSSLKNSIKTVTKYVNALTGLVSYETSLFQLATLEMGYSDQEAETSNVSRYDYYKNETQKESSKRVKRDFKGNLSRVWLRSPEVPTYGAWISAWTVDSNGKIETHGVTWGGLGLDQEYEAVSPAFCI